jgi:glycosyltransferase involved in cell wall biosynthesis
MAELSIILTSKYVNKGLLNTIDNWLNQDYKDKEIIVVTPDKKKIDRKIVRVADLKKGPSAARNMGLKKAGGKYICFRDSDEYSIIKDDKNLLDYTMKKVKKENPDCVYFFSYPVKTGNLLRDIVNIKDTINTKNVLETWPVIIKKSIIKKGFDEGLEYGEDVEFFSRIKKACKRNILIDKPMMNDSSIENMNIFFNRYRWYGDTMYKFVKRTRKFGVFLNLASSLIFLLSFILSFAYNFLIIYNVAYLSYYYIKKRGMAAYCIKNNLIAEFILYPFVNVFSQLIILAYLLNNFKNSVLFSKNR